MDSHVRWPFQGYNQLLQNNPLPQLVLSHGGFVYALNPAAQRLLDRPAGEILRVSLSHFMDEPEAFRFLKFLRQVERLQEPLDGHFELLLGQEFIPLQISVTPCKLENALLLNTVLIPLRSHPSSQPWLRFQSQRSDLIDAIDGIAWEAVVPLRFTFVSPQVERILGYPAQRWIAEPRFWEEHIHADDREKTVDARHHSAQKGASHVLEYRMHCADRRLICVRDSAIAKQTAEGLRLTGIISDITELRAAQEELRKSNERLEEIAQRRTAQLQESLQAMETFCYGIAHDLRAPVRTIQSFVAVLMSDYSKHFDATAQDYAERIGAGCRHLDKLIHDLLAYGGLNFSDVHLHRIELRSAVAEAIDSLAEEIARTKAQLDVSANLPAVTADPALLRHILVNLVTNALKFTNPSSKPEINIRAQLISTKSLQSVVRLTVTDNGIGISPDLQPRIFDIFQRGHHPSEFPGTGTGLAIVKRATELMNGRVGLYSEPGQGSSFWIELSAAT